MMIRLIRNLLAVAVFPMVLTACDPNVVIDEHVAIPDDKWSAKKSVRVEAVIDDSLQPYDIYINVRNSAGYAFSNLFLFINTYTPDGKLARDTVELELADERGEWKGDGLGDIWDNRILFKKKQLFPVTGTYRFELEQAMRVEPLPGIMDAGIRIERSPKK